MDQVRSKFRDARAATQHSQAGAVTVCKLCNPCVFRVHQLLRIVDVGKPNDVAQFVHDHSANQKGTVRPLHDLFKSWGVQCHLSGNQGRGTPGGPCVPAPTNTGNFSFQTWTLLRSGPRNQDRRPPMSVKVSLVWLALIIRAFSGQSVVHELQPCCS